MTKFSGLEFAPAMIGVLCAMVFSNLGAAIGMGKSGTGIGGIG